jgi:FKBP-type peptidyl-prolyl cis-trans isomerase 2
MNTGESKTVKIPPEKAYGPRYDELVLTVERSRFPDDMEPQLGQQLQLRQPDGRTFIVTITDINETAVTLDANHPLAGKDLVFEINLIEIV